MHLISGAVRIIVILDHLKKILKTCVQGLKSNVAFICGSYLSFSSNVLTNDGTWGRVVKYTVIQNEDSELDL